MTYKHSFAFAACFLTAASIGEHAGSAQPAAQELPETVEKTSYCGLIAMDEDAPSRLVPYIKQELWRKEQPDEYRLASVMRMPATSENLDKFAAPSEIRNQVAEAWSYAASLLIAAPQETLKYPPAYRSACMGTVFKLPLLEPVGGK